MNLSATAILVAARPHGETAAIARFLTKEHGLVAAYVAGGRGRHLRPVIIPGNTIAAEVRSKSNNQLPFARLELVESRAPWMTEPLAAAAIGWATALTASTLPERQPYNGLYSALEALLSAICHAPSARGWLTGMVAYEAMLLRELGFGGAKPEMSDDLLEQFSTFRALHRPIREHLLAERSRDVMAARTALGQRLARMIE